MGAGLTISRGPIEAMRPIDSYVNDHYKADNAPEEGHDDKTAAEALLACFLFFNGIEGNPWETECSECI